MWFVMMLSSTLRSPPGIDGRAPSPLFWILLSAFLLRLGVGTLHVIGAPLLGLPPRDWWESGYTFYGIMATNLAEGEGLRLGSARASRPPLYPLLLAAEYLLFGRSNVVPILVQAAIGAGTVLLTWLIAEAMFGKRAALLAAVTTTGYPYYVAHDTAQQETGLFTFLTAGAVYALIRAARSGSLREHILAGSLLGLGALCRESILLFAPLAILWLHRASRGIPSARRAARILLLTSATVAMLAPWVVRNAVVLGRPVLTTSFGLELWIGYNEFTLRHYPWESIDKSRSLVYEALSPEDRAALGRLSEVGRDRWFFSRGLEFIAKNPGRALKYAAVKVLAGFSPIISPLSDRLWKAALYSISYLPVLGLAIIGGSPDRDRRGLALIYLLVLSFVGVSVVTVAHTSHRAYLDVYLIVLASHATLSLIDRTHGATFPPKTSQ